MLEREGGGEERGRHLRGIAIFFKDLERKPLPLLPSRPPGGTGVGRILPPLCTSPPTHPSKAISIYEWFSSTATRLSTPNPLERLPLAGLATFFSLILCRPPLHGKNCEIVIGSSNKLFKISKRRANLNLTARVQRSSHLVWIIYQSIWITYLSWLTLRQVSRQISSWKRHLEKANVMVIIPILSCSLSSSWWGIGLHAGRHSLRNDAS